jgi:hypothetical protein
MRKLMNELESGPEHNYITSYHITMHHTEKYKLPECAETADQVYGAQRYTIKSKAWKK